MAWLLDAVTQVRRILRTVNGGTGNDQGWAEGTIRRCVVRFDEVVPVGAVVRAWSAGGLVSLQDDADAEDTFGVVAGVYRADGSIDVRPGAVAGQSDRVAVGVAGVFPCLVNEHVSDGEFAFPTDDAGQARGETSAGAGSFGRFVGQGDTGSTAMLKLGGGGGGGAAFDDAQVEATFELPTAGSEIETRVPWSGTITGWEMTGDDPGGSAVVDVYVDSLAGYPPDVADSITDSAPPTLMGADTATGSPTGWTDTLTAGQRLVFHVDSVSVHQRLTVSLIVTRSS